MKNSFKSITFAAGLLAGCGAPPSVNNGVSVESAFGRDPDFVACCQQAGGIGGIVRTGEETWLGCNISQGIGGHVDAGDALDSVRVDVATVRYVVLQ